MIDIEICCNSIASAVAAKDGCATRIELCRDLECGGLTPSDEDIAYCVRKLGLRTHVLIRPRAGNFCYTEAEQMEMIASIKRCKALGAAAVVLGFLTEEGKIDVERLRNDMMDYYGTAIFNDFAMAAMNVEFIEMASDQDLIAIAQKEGVDLSKYLK